MSRRMQQMRAKNALSRDTGFVGTAPVSYSFLETDLPERLPQSRAGAGRRSNNN